MNNVNIGRIDRGLAYIQLSFDGATARILPEMGFNLYSWKAFGRELMMEPIDIMEKGCKYGTPLLFPTPNRVTDAVYRWNGKEYKQIKRGEEKLLHGLVNDEVFEYETGHDADSAWAIGTLKIAPGTAVYEGYPFPCVFSVRYDLTATRLLLTYTVENTGSADLPFGFAIHPFYNKQPDPANIIITHPTTVGYESVECFPTGKLIDISGKDQDMREGKAVSAAFVDQVYAGMDSGKTVTVDYRDWGYRNTFRASDDFECLVVYTPPHRPCFCIENQTCSTDAHNLHARGLVKEAHLLVLRPGEKHVGTIEQTISKL